MQAFYYIIFNFEIVPLFLMLFLHHSPHSYFITKHQNMLWVQGVFLFVDQH